MTLDSELAFQEAREAWRGRASRTRPRATRPRLQRTAGQACHAAAQRAAACEAAYKDGFEWPAARGGATPPFELQPGSGRRGPEEVWQRFDEAVAELDRVSEGRSIRAVGRAYAELADAASQIADAVEREDRASGLLPAATRKRRKSA